MTRFCNRLRNVQEKVKMSQKTNLWKTFTCRDVKMWLLYSRGLTSSISLSRIWAGYSSYLSISLYLTQCIRLQVICSSEPFGFTNKCCISSFKQLTTHQCFRSSGKHLDTEQCMHTFYLKRTNIVTELY